MKLKALVMGVVTAAFLAVPTIAMAAWGRTIGAVNLRTGPGIGYDRITTLPAGAEVWVNGAAGYGWLSVQYGNWSGFVSANYVASADAAVPAPVPPPTYYNPPPPPPPVYYRPPPPTYGYWHRPWWDDRYHAWYDGRRWYRNGVWYSSPGFSFGFTIGR